MPCFCYNSTMIYNSKEASERMKEDLKARVSLLSKPPVLAVLSATSHPSTTSFIKIKRRFAEAIGVTMDEYNFVGSPNEKALIEKIKELVLHNNCDALIVQLPLPENFDTEKVLQSIPVNMDADVLGTEAWQSFITTESPVPPVAGAVAHILKDTDTEIIGKKIVIVGHGKLVGAPVEVWCKHVRVLPAIVDKETDEVTRSKLYKEADIVVSGIGSPHHLLPEFFKAGVVLIDAGTSEQSNALAGDCDPSCAEIASIFTPVPGGVGPLTVACLFENVVTFAERSK